MTASQYEDCSGLLWTYRRVTLSQSSTLSKRMGREERRGYGSSNGLTSCMKQSMEAKS
jgi:hypothetical protein